MQEQLDRIEKDFREHREETKQSFREIREVLLGNGNPSKGLAFRVAQVEQSRANEKKWHWAVGITLLAGIGNLFFEAVHKVFMK